MSEPQTWNTLGPGDPVLAVEVQRLMEALKAIAGSYEDERRYMELLGLDTSDEAALREPNSWAGMIARAALRRATGWMA
jgi:hypothetical protein